VTPSADDSLRFSKKQKFFKYLESLDRFTVRQGRLQFKGCDKDNKPIFQQKRVDLWLGLDIALMAGIGKIDLAVLISGDSDLIPAIEIAKDRTVIVRLVHGPRGTYHNNLWESVDERRELTKKILQSLK